MKAKFNAIGLRQEKKNFVNNFKIESKSTRVVLRKFSKAQS